MRTAPQDRTLTDSDWARIAQTMVDAARHRPTRRQPRSVSRRASPWVRRPPCSETYASHSAITPVALFMVARLTPASL